MLIADLRRLLGEPAHVAVAVGDGADAARAAVAHLAPEARRHALAVALADEVGDSTPHRASTIWLAAEPEPRKPFTDLR